MAVETIGEAWSLGWRVVARCVRGREDGPARNQAGRCAYRKELDLETLVCTRGPAFPLSSLERRLRCPRCGNRRMVVMLSRRRHVRHLFEEISVSRASNKARLAVARDDARSRLIERIKKAEEIKADDIRSRDDLAAAEEREKRWREYNSALLSRLFTADEYADEYSAARRSVHVVSDRYIDPSLSDLAGRLVNSINSQISTLRSIIERLELIDEGTAPEPQMETSEFASVASIGGDW